MKMRVPASFHLAIGLAWHEKARNSKGARGLGVSYWTAQHDVSLVAALLSVIILTVELRDFKSSPETEMIAP